MRMPHHGAIFSRAASSRRTTTEWRSDLSRGTMPTSRPWPLDAVPMLRPFCLLFCAALAAQDPPTEKPSTLRLPPTRPAAGRLNLATTRTITNDGVVQTEVTVTFSAWEYEAFKAALGEPAEVLRRLLPESTTALQQAPPRAAYVDDTGSLVLERTELGGVRANADGMRTYRVEDGIEFVELKGVAGRPAAKFHEAGSLFGMPFDGVQKVLLPQLASETTFDAKQRTLSWRPVRVATPAVPARLTVALTAAERVLSGAYKAYAFGGDHWVGRLVIANRGPSRVTQLRCRSRVEGYSEWSPWAKAADLAPGETVVECLYPVLAAATAQLRSDTPVNLLVEWRYVDGDGTEKGDADGARLVLLGGNDFVFARSRREDSSGSFAESYDNAALLAAWVSRDDPIVREFAALGAKRAGGAAANAGLFAAMATLKGLYEILVANDVTYQHPPSLSDTTLSFANSNVQNVKYPRDVLRDRSGTCIDLAVLYASMLHATGLPAYLCVVPGHCFPVVGMPDGGLCAVEVTGVGGGGRMGADAATFGDVLRYGQDELDQALQGPHVLVDLRHEWTHGVSCPELPPVPPDFVEKKKLRETIPPEKQAHLVALRAESTQAFAGTHPVVVKDKQGNTNDASLRIAVSVDAKTYLVELTSTGVLPVDGGQSVAVDVTQVFEGRALFNLMKCRGLRKIATQKDTATVFHLLPDELSLESWNGEISGQLTLAGSGGEPETLEIAARPR